MPGIEHNGIIEMFRENPSLAVHILATLFHREVPPHVSVRVADSGLDQLIPVLTDPTVATNEVELAVLSAMAHGNGPQGLLVVQAAFLALGRLDREHEAVYFHIIWNVLREPMQRALEALAMEQQTEGKATLPPFAQQLIERGIREGIREGKLDGIREGKLDDKRETLLRLLTRAGIALTKDERGRIQGCAAPAVLDRWVDNVLGAKTVADVLT